MSSISYRKDIDGLRAVAVVIVILFHAKLGFKGGFIGVDVFFVISGFLISSLIFRDLEQKEFSFREFWERRVRRIFPALCVVVVVTLALGWVIQLPGDYDRLAQSAVAQETFVSNFHFWRQSGYFDQAAEERPLLHTWSLAVEEQFYFVLPIALVMAFRLKLLRRNLLSAVLLGLVCVAGLVVAQYGVVRHHIAAFYLLPFRAWELMCGVAVALIPAEINITRPMLREIVAWLAFLGIAVPAFAYTNDTPFPGLATVPPCLGTAILLWLNKPSLLPGVQPTSLARILSRPSIVLIGLVSYSLYLWHWPIFVFAAYWAPGPLSLAMRLGLIALSFVLALLSWRYVERPFRQRKPGFSRATVFSLAAGSTAAIIAFGLYIQREKGIPTRFAPAVLTASEVQFLPQDPKLLMKKFRVNGIRFIQFGTKECIERTPDFVVWGDSHAQASMPAFETMAVESNLCGLAIFRLRNPPIIGEGFSRTPHMSREAVKAADTIVDYIEQHKIKTTFLVACWELYESMDRPRFEKALRNTIQKLDSDGSQPYIVLDVPSHEMSVPKGLARNILFSIDDQSWRRTSPDHRRRNSVLYEVAASDSTARFIDPATLLVDPTNDRYRVADHGVPLYKDSNHISGLGAQTAILPLLREHFSQSSALNNTPAEHASAGSN
jgi:peptidoglycan/LPS O-acetylase OafA/YrhL